MDLKLKITQKPGTNMSSLVKQMCALRYRIKVDAESGNISIEGMNNSDVENVIDSINEAFNIVGVDIIPNIEIPEQETSSTIEEKEALVTAESLEFAKINFFDQEVEEQANKLMRVIYWHMYNNKASSADICKYLKSVGAEIKMKYEPQELPKIFIGDIVVCNYGNHPNGEISGGYVHAIVCDIDEEGMIYAVPITKIKFNEVPNKYLPFENKSDVFYTEPNLTGGTLLLKRGAYISSQRIWKTVGTARTEFFDKLLKTLPETVCFSHYDMENEDAANQGEVELVSSEDEEEIPSDNSSIQNISKCKPSNDTKKTSAEDFIAELLSDSLEMLDKSMPIEENVDKFIKGIGFDTKGEIVKQAFINACKVDKISYESILPKLVELFPNIREEIIKASLKEEFNNWAQRHPEIKEKYPKISFMALLKVFVKNKLS